MDFEVFEEKIESESNLEEKRKGGIVEKDFVNNN